MDKDLIEKAKKFKALGHPARLTILKFLADSNTCISGEFSNELPLSRTTISQHLSILKKVGLLKWHTEGAKTYYCLDLEGLEDIKTKSNDYFNLINTSKNYKCK
ncbi:MAG: metalloregulator ArsR/SmtB family transcription factor [Bacteroidales bacterium]|nr:metalloregulator ArsR/SmtB family transcription factor [Bacteroidales bacterium]